MFSLPFPQQRTQFEVDLSGQPDTCNGMKPYVGEHKSDFHNLFDGSRSVDSNVPLHNDYSLALRLMVQDFKDGRQVSEQSTERIIDDIKPLNELLSPELHDEFNRIIGDIENRTQLRDGEIYSPLTLDDNQLAKEVDKWTVGLLKELGLSNKEASTKERRNERHQVQAQVDFYFSSLLDLRNSQIFVQEVQKFFQGNNAASQNRRGFIKDLSSRYPLSHHQVSQLVDIVEPNRYSPSQICKVLKSMGKEYKLANRKGQLVGTSMKFAAASLASSLSGYMRQSALGVPIGNTLMRLSVGIGVNARNSKVELLQDMKKELNQRCADALLMKQFGDIDESKFAEIHTALSRGRGASYDLLSNLIADMGPQALGVGSSLGFMGLLHPALGLASLSSLPMVLYRTRQFLPKFEDLQRLERQSQQANAEHVQSITDSAENVLTSPNPDLIADELKNGLNEQDGYSLDIEKLNIEMHQCFEGLFWNAMIASSVAGVGLWGVGEISEGEVFASSSIAAGVQNPLLNLIANSTRFLVALQQVQEMEEVLQSGETVSLAEDAAKPDISTLPSHDIEVRGLEFTGEDGTTVLKDINLKVKQGDFMTITGRSGGGKSTLLKCLLGLYKPTNGSVCIGGIPREELRQNGKSSVKSMISACNQNPVYLPHKTLRENLLLYSKEKVDDGKIKGVLDQLGLSEFRDKLDDKLERPSGGQRLRIGLASALLRGNGDTKILILDEPTSGLDFQTREEIIDCLKKLHDERDDLTIICVTHSKEVRDAIGNNFDLSDYINRQGASS